MVISTVKYMCWHYIYRIISVWFFAHPFEF